MMRTVRVSGGFSDVLTTDLVDALGSDPGGSTVRSALVPEDQQWPAAASPSWKVPEVEPGSGGLVVSHLVPATQTLGHFHWWLHVQNGLVDVLVRVEDPDSPGVPWLVHVT